MNSARGSPPPDDATHFEPDGRHADSQFQWVTPARAAHFRARMKLQITVNGQQQAAVLEGRGTVGGSEDDLIRIANAPPRLIELWPEGPVWRVRTRVAGRVNGVAFPAHVGRVFCPGELIEFPGELSLSHVAEAPGVVGTAAVLKDLLNDDAPASSPSLPVLICLTGAESGRRFALMGNEALIGRGEQCQVSLRDGSVSRKHARIERRGSKFWLEDLDSPNGVFVNSRRISRRAILADGVVIEVGQSLLRFQAPADNQPGPRSDATPNFPLKAVTPPPPPEEAPAEARIDEPAVPVAAEPPPSLERVDDGGEPEEDEGEDVIPVNEPPRTLGVQEKALIAAGVLLMAAGGIAAVVLS